MLFIPSILVSMRLPMTRQDSLRSERERKGMKERGKEGERKKKKGCASQSFAQMKWARLTGTERVPARSPRRRVLISCVPWAKPHGCGQISNPIRTSCRNISRTVSEKCRPNRTGVVTLGARGDQGSWSRSQNMGGTARYRKCTLLAAKYYDTAISPRRRA